MNGKYGTGAGWDKIIEPLVTQARKENVKIHQVKEKFGGLRFYISAGSCELNHMIDKAEKESYTICETCGEPGEPRRGGWIKTLCNDCHRGITERFK